MTIRMRPPFVALLLAGALFALLAVWLRPLFDAAPEIIYAQSAEIGPEIIVRFPVPLSEDEAKRSFRIEPDLWGDVTWFPEYRELHFLPAGGFDPSVTYRITVRPSSRLFAAIGARSATREVRSAAAGVAGTLQAPAIPPQGKFLDVNLATMALTLFENGKAIQIYPILGKGNPWLTPTREGVFRITEKKDRNFSTIYRVWQPYNMRYSGPYSIHGVPYWPNGRRLTSVYSGGCVRLPDDVAKAVYDWIEVGTPVTVHSTPGKISTLSAASLRDGDLVREEHQDEVYVIRQVGEKRFKRHVMTEKFGEWYPHLSPFWRRVKVVPDGTLEAYRRSRWARTDIPADEKGNRFVYEIRAPGEKHVMQCAVAPGSTTIGPQYCERSWQAHGWDPDEIFTVSPNELASYAEGFAIALPQAPTILGSN